MRKNKTILFNILIAAALLMFGVAAALATNNAYGITALQQSFPRSSIVGQPKGKLLKDAKITGNIRAVENNLGMITVGFLPYTKTSSEDTIRFQIKEEQAADWYYTGFIESGAVEGAPIYPFGFPVIGQSKNKQYVFEITSLSGTEKNALQLNTYDPHVTAVYRYSTSGSGMQGLIFFIGTKVVLSLTSVSFSLRSLVFFLPFFLFVFRKKSSMMQIMLPMAILTGIVVDIIFVQQMYTGMFAFFALYWIVLVRKYQMQSEANFVIAALLCLFWIPLVLVSSWYMQNKLNIWLYFFLVFGAVQTLVEEWRARRV